MDAIDTRFGRFVNGGTPNQMLESDLSFGETHQTASFMAALLDRFERNCRPGHILRRGALLKSFGAYLQSIEL